MPLRDVVVGLHWPHPDFGDSASWEFDPGRVYRQASRNSRSPWGLWTSPKTSQNGWNRCTAARELEAIGDLHWEVTIDVSDMLRLDCSEDLPAEFRWDVAELGFGLQGWEVDWRAVQDAGYTGLHVPHHRLEDDPHYRRLWWSRLDCDCTVVWDLAAVLDVRGPFRCDV